jgi:hypothetical protein
VETLRATLGVSERRACQVLDQHRSTQRKAPQMPDDEAALTADIVELAKTYGRYGYRRITALLRNAGWLVSKRKPTPTFRGFDVGAETGGLWRHGGRHDDGRGLIRGG